MDLTAASALDTDFALAGAEDGRARDRGLDASGPLWPLALNGWMSLDRLPVRLVRAIRAHARADAAAVPAPRSGAAP